MKDFLEGFIGDIVDVPEPLSGENWAHAFKGQIDSVRGNNFVIVDQENNAFEIEPSRVIKKFEFKVQMFDLNPNALFADGFDDAIIGYAKRCGQPALVAYDVEKCISILQRDMSYEEAVEYFDFNVAGAWVGEHTPLFLYSTDAEAPEPESAQESTLYVVNFKLISLKGLTEGKSSFMAKDDAQAISEGISRAKMSRHDCYELESVDIRKVELDSYLCPKAVCLFYWQCDGDETLEESAEEVIAAIKKSVS